MCNLFIIQKFLIFKTDISIVGTQILARHSLLSRTIGTFSEEDQAHHTTVIILVCLVPLLLLCYLAELSLYYLFNFHLHPWAELLQDKVAATTVTLSIELCTSQSNNINTRTWHKGKINKKIEII